MANLFAQNSANWDSANMWNTVANGSGSYVTPGASDVCMANGKTVTVNISPTVSQVRNDTTGGATSGGTLTLSNGVTLTASVYSAANFIYFTLNYPNAAYIVGNITAPSAQGSSVINSGTGTLTITGNITGTSTSTSYGVNISAGLVIVYGNLTCAVQGTSAAAINMTGGELRVTGTVYGSSSGGTAITLLDKNPIVTITGDIYSQYSWNGSPVIYAAYPATSCTITITGNLYGSNNYGVRPGTIISISIPGTLTINGNVYGGSGCAGVNVSSSFNVTITGNVVGYPAGSSAISTILFTSSGNLTINGNVTGGTNLAAGVSSSAGTVQIYGTVTAGPGTLGGPGLYHTGSIDAIFTNVAFDPANCNLPIYGRVKFRTPLAGVTWKVADEGNTVHEFYSPAALLPYNPSPSDVRQGTSYQNGGLTGTMIIPPTSAVAYGTPVDNTTGTAMLTPGNVWDYLTSNTFPSGSIGEKMKNIATVDIVGSTWASHG